jgi:hypothetical protein
MLDNNSVKDALSVLIPAQYDVLIVQANNGLQNIEDPRVRFNTMALNFVLTCRVFGLDQKAILEMVNRACEVAQKQDTAEMRGSEDYIRNEY